MANPRYNKQVANKRVCMKDGGMLKPVNKSKNPGLAKLPTKVRNKMGYMKDGGKVMRKAGLNVGETLKQFKDLMTGSKDSKMSKQKEIDWNELRHELEELLIRHSLLLFSDDYDKRLVLNDLIDTIRKKVQEVF